MRRYCWTQLSPPHPSRKEASISYCCTAVLLLAKDGWGLAIVGHDITVLDNFESYSDFGIKDYNVNAAKQAAEESGFSYELVEEPSQHEDLVDDLVSDFHILYLQADQAGVRKSVEEPAKVNTYTVNGTMNALKAVH